MKLRENPPSARKPHALALVLATVIMSVSADTHQKAKAILEQAPSITSTKIKKRPLTRPASIVTQPASFFHTPIESSPLPTTSTGHVSLIDLLIELNGCGVWGQCVISNCGECGEPEGVPRPLQCETEDGWMFVDYDESTNSVGFFDKATGGASSYTPSVFWSNDREVLCERLNTFEEERGRKVEELKRLQEFMTRDGWFASDGKREFFLSPPGGWGGKRFTMMLEGQEVEIDKMRITIGLEGAFDATIGIMTYARGEGKIPYIKTIELDADDAIDFMGKMDAFMKQHEMRPIQE